MNNCTLDCIQNFGHQNYAQICNFVQTNCQQSFVQFIKIYFCGLHSSFLLLILFGSILFTLLYLALNALTEHSLAPAVENFIVRFQISHALAGVSFLAFANGSPDVLTAILAGTSSSNSTILIPFGSIFGASLFSTAFILSAVIFLCPGQKLTIKKNQILLPIGFYIFGMLYLITISFTYQKMNIYLASVLIIAYVIFICLILKNQKKRMIEHKTQSQNQISQADSDIQSKKKLNILEVEQPEELQVNQLYILLEKVQKILEVLFSWLIPPRSNTQWNFLKILFSLVVSPFVIGFSQNIQAALFQTIFQIPLIFYMSIPAFLLLIHIVICEFKGWRQVQGVLFTIYSFIITVCWVAIICATLINLLQLMQLLTNINSVFLGLTLLAWANCIGDYISITMFAKRGKAATAISGIFSGQLFNFLIGFGLSLFVQSLNGQYQFDIFKLNGSPFEIISDSIVVLVICAGLIYFITIFCTVIKVNGIFQHKEGVFFRYYYIGFLLIAFIIAISTDFFRQQDCDY